MTAVRLIDRQMLELDCASTEISSELLGLLAMMHSDASIEGPYDC